jgi:ADP-heptose:LPS heptosyltransferase
MTGVEASYERGAYPLIQHSREELYSFNAGMGVENVSLDGAYELTSEEVSVGKKLFEDQGLDLNEFTVALCGFSLQPNKDWGKDDAKWVELEKFIKKMKLQIAKMQPEYSLGENLGMLSYCSLTVTPDNDLLDFLAALELPSISLLSPHWKTRVKNYKNTTIVSADEALARGVSEEPFNVMQFSALMESISTSNVFSKILIYLKNWKNSKLEQQQELEIVANE